MTLSDFRTCNILQLIAITTRPSNKYQYILVKKCLIFIVSIAIFAIPIYCSLGESHTYLNKHVIVLRLRLLAQPCGQSAILGKVQRRYWCCKECQMSRCINVSLHNPCSIDHCYQCPFPLCPSPIGEPIPAANIIFFHLHHVCPPCPMRMRAEVLLFTRWLSKCHCPLTAKKCCLFSYYCTLWQAIAVIVLLIHCRFISFKVTRYCLSIVVFMLGAVFIKT